MAIILDKEQSNLSDEEYWINEAKKIVEYMNRCREFKQRTYKEKKVEVDWEIIVEESERYYKETGIWIDIG